MNRTLAVIAAFVAGLAVACSTAGGATTAPSASAGSGCPTAQPEPLPAGESRIVTVETSEGDIEITVVADLSPIAVGNFGALAECGYYDGVVFHRVVPGFVIQAGDGENGRAPGVDPSMVGTGGPGYTIEDEAVTTPYGRGVVAMARTSQPNSVGSQFFIVLDDEAEAALASANTYQIIGRVAAGMETADAIAAAADQEIPSDPVPMDDVTVSTP
jgi:cyclophilin family peptidyl-prolyl cis-trans isomerase